VNGGAGDRYSGKERQAARIGEVLKPVEYYLKANRQGLLAIQDSLGLILPAELAAQVQVVGVNGGVLTLSVADAASKCLLETLLRGPGFSQVQKALPQMFLRKVRVMLT